MDGRISTGAGLSARANPEILIRPYPRRALDAVTLAQVQSAILILVTSLIAYPIPIYTM